MSQDNKNTSAKASGANATKKDGGKGDAPAKKSLTLTISFSTVTTFVVVLLGCVCMAFVMGVIVGRGDNPETHLPQIAALMPDDGNKPAEVIENNENKKGMDKIMPTEDLDFSSLLKKRGEAEPEEEGTDPAVSTAITAIKEAVNKQENTTSIVEDVKTPAQAPIPAPAPAPEPVIFDYIFQVATFTDEASVDRLRETLEGNGLRTRMEKAGKFFKVLVLMRGTAEQAQALQDLMVDMKLGKPLQRGKKAI